MPELPEVETVRLGLLKHLPGKAIRSVTVHRPDSVGYPDPDEFARALKGHKFVDIERRGKYLIFKLDKGAAMGAHLRMSGRLLVTGTKKQKIRDEHVRVSMELDDGNKLLFEDMRVFGRLWYVPKGKPVEKIVSGLAELGIEPLEGVPPEYLQEAFKTKTQPIKSALLDQTIIAGIGNIYADESLHLSGINPLKPARELSMEQLTVLAQRIQEVLSRAIGLGGSSLRNYTDSNGVNGNYQHKAWVYGREGLLCHSCATEIVRVKLAGRSSHYCPTCQPLKGKRSAKKVAIKRTARR